MILVLQKKLYGFWKRPAAAKKQLLLIVMLLTVYSFSAIAADELKFRVDIILAGNAEAGIDSRLADLQKDISKYFKYTSLRLVSSQSISTHINKDATVSIPENGHLVVTPVMYKHKQVTVKLQCNGPRSFNTQFRQRKDAMFIFNGAPSTEGDVLIALTFLD